MSARYSGTNLLYPPFYERLKRGLELANRAGIPLRIFESHRSFERQNWLYAQGRTRAGNRITNARGGLSFHQYGVAADLVLFIEGRWTWERRHEYLYRKAGHFFEAQGLVWLGRSSGDLVHYQLDTRRPAHELSQIYQKSGFEGVWLYLDKELGFAD